MELAPTIEFKGITFKFDEANNTLFSNSSFKIEAGKIIGLIGESGSGKSTLLNLITKLYRPNTGTIMINGQDISTLDSEWVQENVAYVPQEPVIFVGTVYENIIYGNQGFDITKENVMKAAKIAGAHNFIEQLPQGYETVLTEKGQSLSGGQRQRIIIARAILKDPTIMLLDEATSSLDEETERQIVKELREICKNRTCIIVSHRMQNFNDILDLRIELKDLKKSGGTA
jgi:ABC-type bacteriocin/lantibiotic exporter with double-glycine peptidase domain